MRSYKQAWVTLLGVALALCACNQKKGNSTMDAPPPQSMRQFEMSNDDHRPTAWDESGYQAFRRSGGDVTEEFFTKYAGRFTENTPKVNGYLEIARGRLILKAGTNVHRPKESFCRIDVKVKIEAVTKSDTGYVLWIRPDGASRDCLLARMEPIDIKREKGRLGLAFDYYNANTLRLSLQDAYVFFLRN